MTPGPFYPLPPNPVSMLTPTLANGNRQRSATEAKEQQKKGRNGVKRDKIKRAPPSPPGPPPDPSVPAARRRAAGSAILDVLTRSGPDVTSRGATSRCRRGQSGFRFVCRSAF